MRFVQVRHLGAGHHDRHAAALGEERRSLHPGAAMVVEAPVTDVKEVESRRHAQQAGLGRDGLETGIAQRLRAVVGLPFPIGRHQRAQRTVVVAVVGRGELADQDSTVQGIVGLGTRRMEVRSDPVVVHVIHVDG